MRTSPREFARDGRQEGRIPAPGQRSALTKVWETRWLLLRWTQRDFTVQYRQSLLGVVWALAQPLLLLVFYGFVFKGVLRINAPRGSYLVFALCGLAPWTFLSSVLNRSASSLIGATTVVRQVYFPRSIIPLAATGVTMIDLGLATVVLLAAQLATAGTIHLSTLALVPIYLGLVLLMAGISVFVALVGALVRDIRFVIPLAVQVGFIATPVMYPRSLVPHRYAWVYDLNPVARTIEAVRVSVIDGRWPSLGVLLGPLAVGLVVLAVALCYSASVEDRLPDLL